MPATFAHPAFALPLTKVMGRFGEPWALAVGAMIPDLPYFTFWSQWGKVTHTPLGLLLFCLPAGVLFWLLLRRLLLPLLVELFPAATALPHPPKGLARDTLTAISLSVLAGAISHVTIDAFTHPRHWGVVHLPYFLNR